MISTLRYGPNFVVLGSRQPDDLNACLLDILDSKNVPPDQALNLVYENATVVFIVPPNMLHASFDDVKYTLFVYKGADQVLADILNHRINHLMTDVRLGPSSIIMRTVGNYMKMVENIGERYNGSIAPFMECLDNGTSDTSIISFTEHPLNRRVTLDDLKSESLLVPVRPDRLYRELRSYALRYLNEALDGEEWYELLIRIYDKFGAYDLHFERLMLVLDSLEIGIDLGETWTKEYALHLMPIMVYQLRYITITPPREMKKILVGLEYLDNGDRIVDYDLHIRNRKLSWTDAVDRKFKGKKEAGVEYRKRIMSILTPEEKIRMERLEQEISKSRS